MPTGRRRGTLVAALTIVVVLAVAGGAAADTTTQSLPFTQNWTNTGLIAALDDWSGVPGVVGHRGDGLVASTAVDPQTVVADGSLTPVDVNHNQTNPNGFTTGGVSEFEIADPVVALQGSGTADAPHVVFRVSTTGAVGATVSYNLRDVDGSADNAVQPIALQYRVGTTGAFTNLPAGFVADATTGPSLATLVTPISVALPAAAIGQSHVEVRVITTDAAGSDEWVGIDDISITALDTAPTVATTSPANGAVDVPTTANITVNFSESVATAAGWYSITCTSSGSHTATQSGGPQSYTLNPDADFVMAESCSVTVDASKITDVDTDDPPDQMAASHVFSFATSLPLTQIAEVQGAGHLSPFAGQSRKVEGIVIAERGSSVWLQDPTPDANAGTSEGILVFGSTVANAVVVGDRVHVTGTVAEFRPGCAPTPCLPTSAAFDNLTITQLASPGLAVTNFGPSQAPAATVIGTGGRIPPRLVIDNDSTGSVETSGVYDPSQDGLDFYESLESMLVQVNNAVVVGSTNDFGEIWVVGDNGANASVRTSRGGVLVRDVDPSTLGDYRNGDFNPERIQLDDFSPATPSPDVHVRDRIPGATVGILNYDFANFELLPFTSPVAVPGGLQRETTRAPRRNELTVATFNVENLDPSDAPTIPRLAQIIVQNLRSPDLIGIEEMQDNNGALNDGTTAANLSWQALIAAIAAAGGPTYDHRQIDPVDNMDGGQPGGNIRVGFLFRTDRGLAFVDRAGGNATTPTDVFGLNGRAHLTLSPGRVDPINPAWVATRKPLAGEFTWRGKTFFAIVNHFSSKGGDDPLFGRHQPPVRVSEIARHQQAASVNAFVKQILAIERRANVIVLGDINDFEFSETTKILEGRELVSLMRLLPQRERYSYVFEGNSQVLDQILFSRGALGRFRGYDVVHVNAEFHDQASDHDPSVARFNLGGDDDDDDDDEMTTTTTMTMTMTTISERSPKGA